MSKWEPHFKVGDMVWVTLDDEDRESNLPDAVEDEPRRILRVDSNDPKLPYLVEIPVDLYDWGNEWFTEDQLRLQNVLPMTKYPDV